jgi:hypothetical protein
VIIEGDLDFTFNRSKVWEASTKLDRLAYLFRYKVKELRFVDVEPIKISPTWCKEGVSKWLENFLVVENFMCDSKKVRLWVEIGWGLFHMPILLQLEKWDQNLTNPF